MARYIKGTGSERKLCTWKCVHCNHQQAKRLLEESHNDVKIAVIMGVGKISYDDAKNLLSHNGGNVHEAINEANKL